MPSDAIGKKIDISKITEKERVVINYRSTGRPMKKFEDEVGTQAGIREAYANKLFQKAKKKTGLNSAQLLSSADSLGLLD